MSAGIPSFFNKSDFYGTLLPGYLAIIVYFFLYQPAVIFNATDTSLNLLWTVIFLVAGPVVGLTLAEVHGIVMWYLWRYTKGRGSKVEEQKPTLKLNYFYYYWTRIHTKDNELSEIDLSEAEYDFNVSAGIGLIGLGLGKLLLYSTRDVWAMIIVVTGAILFVAAYFQSQSYGAVMSVLWQEHDLHFPKELVSKPSLPPPPRERK